MGSTPKYGLPFPDGGELANSSAFQNLAFAIESMIDSMALPDNPTFVTVTPINQWESVGGELAGDPLRLYRFGRLTMLFGEIINRQGATSSPVSTTRKLVAKIPDGWRPTTRLRTTTIRNVAEGPKELYVDKNGDVRIPDAQYAQLTPGYSINAVWVIDG